MLVQPKAANENYRTFTWSQILLLDKISLLGWEFRWRDRLMPAAATRFLALTKSRPFAVLTRLSCV